MEEYSLLLHTAVDIVGYSAILPALVLLFAVLWARVGRVPVWGAALISAAPLLVALPQFPFHEPLLPSDKFSLVAFGLLCAGCAIAGWATARWLHAISGRGSALTGIIGFFGATIILGLFSLQLWLADPYAEVGPMRSSSPALYILLLTAYACALSIAALRALSIRTVFIMWSAALCAIVLNKELLQIPVSAFSDEFKIAYQPPQPRPPQLAPEKVALITQAIAKRRGELHILVLGSLPPSTSASLIHSLNAMYATGYPDKSVHVHNMASAAQSSDDFEALLSEMLPKLRPDIVMVGGWLADSQRGVNRYGLVNLSEREAAKQIAAHKERAEAYGLIEPLIRSRLAGFAVHTIRNRSRSEMPVAEPPLRVSPSEYAENITRAFRMIEQAGAVPVAFQQPVAPWYEPHLAGEYNASLMAAVETSGAQYAEVQDSIESHRFENLFFDTAHLSPFGVHVVAQTLRDALFSIRESPHLTSAKRAIINEAQRVAQSSAAFTARQPFPSQQIYSVSVDQRAGRYYQVLFSINGHFVQKKRLNQPGPVRFRFAIPKRYQHMPAAKFSLHALTAGGSELGKLGKSEQRLPATITFEHSLRSGVQRISTVGRVIEAPQLDTPLLGAVQIDPESGSTLNSIWVDASDPAGRKEFASYLLDLPWGSLVGLTMQMVPEIMQSEDLIKAIEYAAPGVYLSNKSGVCAGVGFAGVKDAYVLQCDAQHLAFSLGEKVPQLYRAITIHESAA